MNKNKTLTADDFFDQKMMNLMNQAMAGKIKMCEAAIKIEGLIPLVNYKPKITQKQLEEHRQKIETYKCEYIYVYPQNDKFVISTDYELYYLYKELGFKILPCVVLGEAKGKYVVLATTGRKLTKLE